MDLFNLLAKLTLDTKEYDSKVSSLEKANVSLPDAKLGLDADEFDRGIAEANAQDVDNKESDLELNDDTFYSDIEKADSEKVENKEADLTINNDEFNAGIEQSQELSSGFGSAVESIFNNLGGALMTGGVVAAVTSVVAALKEGIELAKNHGDEIDKQSQKMNISAKAYQEWSYALTLSGASITDLNRGLRTWQSAAGDEDSMNKLTAEFEKLGISADYAKNEIAKAASGQGTLDDLLNKTMAELADYNEGDKGYIASILFGKSANGLNALLNQTGDQIKDALEEANDLGLVMTDEEVKNAAAYMDATTRLELSVNAIKESVSGTLIPDLTEAANTLAKIVAFFNPRTKEKNLLEDLASGDEQLEEELLTIEGTAAAAETLADKLLAMGSTSKMTADQYEEWKKTAEALIEKVPELGKVIDTDTGKITANKDEIHKNIEAWEELAKKRAMASASEEQQKKILKAEEDALNARVEAKVAEADIEKERVKAIAAMNKELAKYGREQMTGDADYDTIMKKRTELESLFSADPQGQDQIKRITAGYEKSIVEAEDAKNKAEQYGDSIEKAKLKYQAWLEAAEALYGTLDEEAEEATQQATALKDEVNKIPDKKKIILELYEERMDGFHAAGAWNIPYDGYRAVLHRGEQVLSASQARQKEAAAGTLDITNLEDRIIAAIKEGMSEATVPVYMDGKKVSREVSENLARENGAGRFK